MKKAFSLIELLISLIIISLITSSLVPIITKKLKYRNVTYSTVQQTKSDCSAFNSEQGSCLLCTQNECSLCSSSINLPEGYYVNPKLSCDIKECSEGCSKCNDTGCLNCLSGWGYNPSDKTCVLCPDGAVSISGTDQCIECKASEHKKANTTKTACEDVYCSKGQYIDGVECKSCPDNTYQSSAKHQQASCLICDGGYVISDKCIKIAKVNAGDPGGLGIPGGIDIRAASGNTYGSGPHSQPICWKGTTSAICNADNGGYSGCTRTVCTWYAADKICKHHGWRLPTREELSYFYSFSKGKGSNGLQICDHTAGYSSAQCADTAFCPGSRGGGCTPRYIWGEKSEVADSGYYYHLTSGGWGEGSINSSYAMSVRCVKDL